MAVQIETTQNVVIEQEPAGLGLRTLAYVIDGVILTVWAVIVLYTLLQLQDSMSEALFVILIIFLIVVPYSFYDLLMEVFNDGQSIGKKIMKIKVVNLDGTKPSIGGYLIRWLFRPIDFAVTNYMLSLIMVLTTKNSQRLGDYLANTTVINLKAAKRDSEIQLSDLTFKEDYQVMFPDILERLSDKDIRTVRTVIDDTSGNFSEFTVNQIADRIRFMTGYNFSGPNGAFLRRIVNDYNYMSIH